MAGGYRQQLLDSGVVSARALMWHGLRATAAVLLVGGIAAGTATSPARAQQTASVSVDYSVIEVADLDDGPVIIPPPSSQHIVLKPPHGMTRYTPPTPKRVSLASYLCPCAHHHLKLHPLHGKHHRVVHHHHKTEAAAPTPVAAVTPSDLPAANPPPSKAAPAPQPKPVAAPPAPTPAVAAPQPKVAAASPPPAPTPAPVPAKPAPAPVASASGTTDWSHTSNAPVKPITPPAAPPAPVAPPPAATPAPSAQTLTPPPLPKAPETKTAAAPPPAEAIAKPVEITKPAAEVAAAVPPAVKPSDTKEAVGKPTIVSYAGGGTAVPTDSLPAVKDISDKLAADPNLRVQLFSYASDAEKNVSRSRRLSLERAVAVRKLLIDNGLDSTRIEVRALGDQNNGGEPDRVDIVLSARR